MSKFPLFGAINHAKILSWYTSPIGYYLYRPNNKECAQDDIKSVYSVSSQFTPEKCKCSECTVAGQRNNNGQAMRLATQQ